VIRNIDGLSYVNCGDWVESCTAAVEHFDGQLEIIEWSKAASETRPPQTPANREVPAGLEDVLPLGGIAGLAASTNKSRG
jgi:hypothetical protein